jgi:hypothetical protein
MSGFHVWGATNRLVLMLAWPPVLDNQSAAADSMMTAAH